MTDRLSVGEWTVAPRLNSISRNSTTIRLEPKVMQVLVCLTEARGDVVSKENLIRRVWPDTFVTDDALKRCIGEIRKAFGEDATAVIETIPKVGYRLALPVADSPMAETASVQRGPSTFLKVLSLVAIGALLVGFWRLAVLFNERPAHRSPRVVSLTPIHSLAVLPLDNLSGDPSQDYFADAMTDELITELAKVGALRVTSRTTVTRYKHTNKSLPEIARELNVDGIVEGSVVRSGQRLRITAQLIHGPADQHLWAETYERDFGDVVTLQRDVAQAITKQVHAQLTPELRAQFRSARPVNPEAYEAYLKGRYYLYNQPITMSEPLHRAKTYFEEATRKDPSFSLAYSGLANSYVFLVFLGQGEISAEKGYKSAKQAVKKALELDEHNGEAYDVLGLLSWHADLDWKAADEAFNKAIALAPSFSCAHEDRALFLSFMGRRAESLAEVEKSKQIDPGPLSALTELGVYFQLRDWEHLVEAGQREVASNPNEWTIHAKLGAGYEGTGKLLEAIAEYQKAVELSNGNPDPLASIGHAYAVMGRRTEAQRVLRQLEQKVNTGRASPYLPATVYAGLGQKDKAFELLEKAYREKSVDVSWILKPDLRTDSLRSDPRFQNLLRRWLGQLDSVEG